MKILHPWIEPHTAHSIERRGRDFHITPYFIMNTVL